MLGTTFLLALRSIARHKLRSFLTILGIIIGVGAVVTMVTLGEATTVQVQKSISALGTNILDSGFDFDIRINQGGLVTVELTVSDAARNETRVQKSLQVEGPAGGTGVRRVRPSTSFPFSGSRT